MHQVVERRQEVAARAQVVTQGGASHVPAVAGQNRLLAVQRQVIDQLGDDDVGEQAAADAAPGNRLGRQIRLGDLRVKAQRLARPTGVGGADQLADEQGHRLVVEAFAGGLADADLGRAAAGADFLGGGQIDLLPAARQVRRLAPPAVPLPLRRG